jgi:transposase
MIPNTLLHSYLQDRERLAIDDREPVPDHGSPSYFEAIDMARTTFPSDVPREQFDAVREMLEAARRKTRPRKHDLYDVFCAVLYFLHTGNAWRSMPPEFPPWRTVHEYFTQWTMLRENDRTLLEQALDKLDRKPEITRLRQLTGQR